MDALCVIGRGIERVKTSNGYVWRPTRFIEKLSPNGYHTGYREQSITPDGDSVVIAGANANVLAAIQLFEDFARTGMPPKLVIFAAGRPKYLDEVPDTTLSEGVILAAKFKRWVKTENTYLPEIVIQSGNRNTRDDLEASLALAVEKGVKQLGFITVSVHIERVKEFFNLIRKCNSSFKDVDARFFTSENVLLDRYRSVALYNKMLEQIQKSEAYKRTLDMERKGIEALRSGTYDFSSMDYTFVSSFSL